MFYLFLYLLIQNKNKIFVVESSANEEFKTYSEEENIKTRQRYSNSCPYFYFVIYYYFFHNITPLFIISLRNKILKSCFIINICYNN